VIFIDYLNRGITPAGQVGLRIMLTHCLLYSQKQR